jgi:hypothetical protein
VIRNSQRTFVVCPVFNLLFLFLPIAFSFEIFHSFFKIYHFFVFEVNFFGNLQGFADERTDFFANQYLAPHQVALLIFFN